MVDAPKISVIVPIYKVEPYLRECLDSIVGQTYRNLEIILVDDGSPDNCGAICDEYAARDERVKVIHQSNGGLSSARNAGLEIATGSFLSFVDSDDVVSPVFIQGLLSARADVVQCGCTTELKELKMDSQLRFEYLSGLEMSEKLCEEGAVANTVVWSKLWSRECFERIRFPEGCFHEDEFITWKIFWCTDSVARTKEPLYYYRNRQGSIINTGFSIHSLDSVAALRERFRFYENVGAERLSALTKAVFCHILRGMWKDVSENLPTQAPDLARELRRAYREVLSSKEVGVRKKAALTLRMLCPWVYSAVKCRHEGNGPFE